MVGVFACLKGERIQIVWELWTAFGVGYFFINKKRETVE